MDRARESRPTVEAAHEIPARTKPSLARSTGSHTEARPTFAQRLQWRRRVAVELDHLLGLWPYPDPAITYAMAPSREAALDE
jgi:hypothetical protein